ncbi:hypothetical protein B5X24_HaOG212038 [Helicoverpa armigera]|uniref:Uncharacterized protein n=1 Tax=Helicoverpa armigera TaxID=29058 RepID=A0A2W1BDV7_HELAM|nr:hypothetical protein B5X24_HaOG212038 [Helicoverpa armigera]
MPFTYSNREYLDMIVCYVVTGENLTAARTRTVNCTVTSDECLRFKQSWGCTSAYSTMDSFDLIKPDTGRPRIASELEERVLDYFSDNPQACTRDAGRDLA